MAYHLSLTTFYDVGDDQMFLSPFVYPCPVAPAHGMMMNLDFVHNTALVPNAPKQVLRAALMVLGFLVALDNDRKDCTLVNGY